jgi:hypothetical protein
MVVSIFSHHQPRETKLVNDAASSRIPGAVKTSGTNLTLDIWNLARLVNDLTPCRFRCTLCAAVQYHASDPQLSNLSHPRV